jgi:hypothetical protein
MMLNPEEVMSMDYLSPILPTKNLKLFVRAALEEAEMAGRAGELLIGAVLVYKRI